MHTRKPDGQGATAARFPTDFVGSSVEIRRTAMKILPLELSDKEFRLIIKGLEMLCICEFDVPGASRLLLKLERNEKDHEH